MSAPQGPTQPQTPQASPVGLTLPGAASLVEQLDKRLLVVLRDGRNLVGVMRSFDQYSNMVLEDTFERHVANGLKADISLGLFIVRGDSVVLLGEIDPEKEEATGLRNVGLEELRETEAASPGPKLDWAFDNER